MFSLARQPRWLAFLALTATLCVLFWWLGTWQWHRHEERSARNDAVETAQGQPVEPLTTVVPDPDQLPPGAEYRQVSATGHYVAAAQVLQRNPLGRAGFAVVTPLELDSGGTVLINRGFVNFSLTDPNTPAVDVTPPAGPVEVTMRLRVPEDASDRTAPEGQVYDIDPGSYPLLLSAPVYAAYGDLVDQTPAPTTDLELPEPADLGLGPHLFYAFQWWSFIPIAIVGLVLLLRRESKVDEARTDTPTVTHT